LPGPADAQKAVEEFQRLMVAQDARASASVVRAYAPVYRQLQKDTQALVRIAQEKGLKPWQVGRMDRMRDLHRQFLAGTAKFADAAGDTITNSQRAAVGLARRGAEQTVAAGLPPGISMENLGNVGLGWNRLPEEAFTNFVGIAADGKPLGNLLAPLGPEAAQGVKDAIGTGIATGKGPRQTAQLVRMAAGIPLSKALLITRTETNRAFRESTRLQYANNSQVVKGYRRLAAQSDRTCIACIALDGTLYALDEPLNEHPNGRCALVPDTITYEDLGLDVEMPPQPENARDWLARQPESMQRDMLGDARFEAIQRGDLHLNQLATVRSNAVWGDAAVVRPLRDLGLREGVPARPPLRPPAPPARPTPGAAPPHPTGDLLDPQTNLTVRGTRTAPPEIDNLDELGKAYQSDIPSQFKGREDLFLDTEPYALGRIANDPGAAALTSRMVREQEAWARAVGGAVEVNYEGMSVLAARNTNRAIEQTIVRHNARPLERIVTYPSDTSAFNNASAYQTHEGGVHINMAWAENGSARSIGTRMGADNALKAQQYDEIASGERVQRFRELIAQHEQELTKMVAERKDFIVRRQAAGRAGTQETRDFIAAFESDERLARRTIKKWEQAIVDLEKHHKSPGMRRIRSRQFSTAGTVPEDALTNIIIHEIGHYYHRRYGFQDPKSLRVLSGRKTKTISKVEGVAPQEGYQRIYSMETRRWTGAHKAHPDAFNISEYAGTDDLEHFAEAFTHYYQGGTGLSKQVKDFIEEVIETNKTFNQVDLASVQKVPLGELKGNPKSVHTGLFGRGIGPF